MQEATRRKEEEKKRLKADDERLERDIEAQREMLGRKERAEMRKEGKNVADEPAAARKVDRS